MTIATPPIVPSLGLQNLGLPWGLQLEPAFTGPTTGAALATRGDWAQALRFDRDGLPDSRTLWALTDAADEVALEVFGGDAFFGLRFSGPTRRRRLDEALEAYAAADSVLDFVVAMVGAGHVDPAAPLRRLEIGAVFAWSTVGAVVLPDAAATLAAWDDWWTALQQAPLLRERQHRKALELCHDAALPHWFGLPLAGDGPDEAICPARLRQHLAAIASWAPRRRAA